MRKLTLDLDALDVQAFDTTPRLQARGGTVHGRESDGPLCTTWCASMYNEATTCQVSDLGTCDMTCGNSCQGSCNGGQTCFTCQGPPCEEPY